MNRYRQWFFRFLLLSIAGELFGAGYIRLYQMHGNTDIPVLSWLLLPVALFQWICALPILIIGLSLSRSDLSFLFDNPYCIGLSRAVVAGLIGVPIGFGIDRLRKARTKDAA